MTTNTVKHTPGSWHISTDFYQRRIAAADDTSVGFVLGDGDEVEANARLIAAAPEMLSALKLHAAYEALPADRGGSAGPKGRARAAWIAARDAAISRATGA